MEKSVASDDSPSNILTRGIVILCFSVKDFVLHLGNLPTNFSDIYIISKILI